MKLTNENDITKLINEDEWMMEVLQAAKKLNLTDWWICAGFVRSKIWDTMHNYKVRTPLLDIDVIYFDESNTNEKLEKTFESNLKDIMPKIPWSVKNQARMHIINNLPAYSSAVDGIANFPETVTALGVKLDDVDNVILTAPHGIEDLIHLVIKPTSRFLASSDLAEIYKARILKKNWQSTWPKLKSYYY
ncbi:nucleotidyltransferase family protein [Psychrobacillus sp. FJAT-51614]|uniref:Nucleotidyltransferase family protein n=1 Tax=Psychrobacillus mangrovi TaxID=3117745 RepID=A0ABU8F0F2_9BACI